MLMRIRAGSQRQRDKCPGFIVEENNTLFSALRIVRYSPFSKSACASRALVNPACRDNVCCRKRSNRYGTTSEVCCSRRQKLRSHIILGKRSVVKNFIHICLIEGVPD